MKCYKLLCAVYFFFSFSSITFVLHSIDAGTIYEHNPLRKQVMYTPDRDQEYNAKLDEKALLQASADATAMANTQDERETNGPDKCIFCMLSQDDESNDQKNLLVTRFTHHNLFMNLYPYQKGHMLLLPKRHVKDLSELDIDEKLELIQILSEANSIAKELLGAAGTNIGVNIGKIAGASKPDHMHVHIIPRYEREHVSFIHLVCETQVIGYDMQKLYKKLKMGFDKLKEKLC